MLFRSQVLEVAAGAAHLGRTLARHTAHVTAIDLAPAVLLQGKAQADADVNCTNARPCWVLIFGPATVGVASVASVPSWAYAAVTRSELTPAQSWVPIVITFAKAMTGFSAPDPVMMNVGPTVSGSGNPVVPVVKAARASPAAIACVASRTASTSAALNRKCPSAGRQASSRTPSCSRRSRQRRCTGR